ncbi:MAG: SURF1 family cytochrome oxidase biogenesis protein [Actinomycetota bacterium]
MTRSNFTRAVSILGVILLAITFIGLGLWQWDRAQENRKPLVVDQKLVPLGDIARPSAALDSKAYLRNVSVTGKYISIFKAPNQSDSNGKSSSWDVGLLETKSRSAILVVVGCGKTMALSQLTLKNLSQSLES